MSQAQMIKREDSTKESPLYIAFELSNSKWKLMFGNGIKKRQKAIDARDTDALEQDHHRQKSF